MLAFAQHQKLGKIWYEKNFWSGETTITVDGIRLTRLTSFMYVYEKDDIRYTVVIHGNSFTGIKLNFSSNEPGSRPLIVPIVEPFKVYEYVIAFIATLLVCVWINIGLFFPIPILKMNAIEGVLSGVIGFIALYLAGRTEKTKARIWILVGGNILGLLVSIIISLF